MMQTTVSCMIHNLMRLCRCTPTVSSPSYARTHRTHYQKMFDISWRWLCHPLTLSCSRRRQNDYLLSCHFEDKEYLLSLRGLLSLRHTSNLCSLHYEVSVIRLTFTVKSFGTHGKSSTDYCPKTHRGFPTSWVIWNLTADINHNHQIYLLHLSYHTVLKAVKHCNGGCFHQMMVVLLSSKMQFSSQDFPPFP